MIARRPRRRHRFYEAVVSVRAGTTIGRSLWRMRRGRPPWSAGRRRTR